ncbi:MAG: RidA family protein [Planctomycetes bacterium]|nr:RidA family protein [Planctomycetota bacterium]
MTSLLALFPLITMADEPTAPHLSIRYIEPNQASGSSPAVSVTNVAQVHTAQILPQPISIAVAGVDPLQSQAKSCLQEVERILQLAGSSLTNIVKLNIYTTTDDDAAILERDLSKLLPPGVRPAVSFVRTRLPREHVRVAVDAVAVTTQTPERVLRVPYGGDSSLNTHQKLITVGMTGAAILPIGSRVYVSGQAEAGDGTLRDATHLTMQGLKTTLNFLGLQPADVVQLKAFVQPMSDAALVIEQMSALFPGDTPPPIVLVEWDSPRLPIEIELIAAVPTAPAQAPPIEFLTPPWLKSSPVFARVVRLNHPTTIYTSGLYGSTSDPNSVHEVRDLFGALDRILKTARSDMKHLAKATYYVTTDEVSQQLNSVRPEFYDPGRPPAASKAKVAGVGRVGRTITLDLIATTSIVD